MCGFGVVRPPLGRAAQKLAGAVSVQQPVGLIVGVQQCVDFGLQRCVPCACPCHKDAPLRRRLLDGCFQNPVDAFPALGVCHWFPLFCNSRRRNALARPHSRVTVSG